jgi:PAS domain-containing protein
MQASPVTADRILHMATEAVQRGEGAPLSALDRLSAATYVTDPDGVITYFNPACVDLAGRVPSLGHDRWCVTWKLYTDQGAFLPHDQCPMAIAILERRPIRGVSAVAERPDGSRINFVPHPTPIFDPGGGLLGAVNILIDVTDQKQVGFFRLQAGKCRRLALSVGDRQTADRLIQLAAEYEEKANKLRAA